jgi:hypothetical protein
MSFPKANAVSRHSLFAFIFISLVFVAFKFRQVYSVPSYISESYALSWDNYGYYLHLPATVIYHDVGLENHAWVDALNNKYQAGRPLYQFWPGQKNRVVNVYPVGWAVCNLPFFLAGHTYAKISGYTADGLSPPYQWAMMLSALFYGILGMWWLRKLLLKFFNDKLSALLLLLITFGTNLFYYATDQNIMPHIFLFALDVQIILFTISWHERQKAKTALWIGLLLGLITIIRPSEIVWIFIPLCWNVSGWKSLKEKMQLLLRNFLHLLLLIFGMVAVGSLQLFYWKYTSGDWFSFNHSEGFDFFRPFTLDVLFSYKKGWLLYTPLMALSIFGIFVLYKKQKNLFLPILFFFLANLWFISSWECWWYAGSFGQRPFVQSYGLMAIPLGFLFSSVANFPVRRTIVFCLTGFFVLLNLFQLWQYGAQIIHPDSMTKAYYWKVFGKTAVQPEWKSLLEIDRGNLLSIDSVSKNYTAKEVMNLDYQKPDSSILPVFILNYPDSSSNKCLLLSKDNVYGAPFSKPFSQLTKKDHLRFKYNLSVYATQELADHPFYLVFSMTGRRGQQYGYASIAFDTTNVKPDRWNTISGEFVTPHILHSHDVVNINVWNYGQSALLIDDVKVISYEPK